jgi:glucan phosphoethanolaminetransferase (alkaline phosphatase superfamily)
MQNGPDLAPAVGFVFVLFFLLVGLLMAILMVWVYCRIFSKTGFCWALGLLMFVPIANIIMLFVLAFADWPVLRELRQLKQQQSLKY